MDYRDKKTFHNSGLRSSLLARLIAVLMAVSMVVPYQSLAVYAVQNEPAAASEETADQAVASENQEEPGEAAGRPAASEDKEDPKESPDQSEAAETRDSSEQASGDQKQEDAKTQNDNASGGNTVSEEGKQPSESSSPAKKASVNDGSQADRQSDGTDNEGNEEGATGKTAEEAAEEYYKDPGGKAKTYTVTLKDDKADTDTVYAGDEISYSVKIAMQAAARYKYDGQNTEPMFDQWKNIRIYLTLPENVVPVGVKQPGIVADDEPFVKVPGTDNTWEVVLIKDTRDATSSNSINFDVVTRITGNGKLADGTVLSPAEVEVTADFDVRIKEDETQPDSYRTYSRDITSSPTEEITLSTPDEWIINKRSYQNPKQAYTISDDKKTVTIHYLLVYGLNVNGVPEDDKNVYFRHGRVPYDGEIYLTDTPELTLQDGSKPEAKSITVTPKVSGYMYNDSAHTSADDTSGNPKPITVTKGQQIRLPYAVVGTNTDNVDEYAPAYSQYDVDMVYDYEDFMVWYYEPDADPDAKAHSYNDAKIDYTLLGQTAKDTDDHNTTDVPGYIPPGTITVKKFIVDYMSGNRNPYDSNIELPVTGPARYKIYKKDGTSPAVIYEKIGDSEYRQITGNTVTIDPGAAKTATNGTDGTITFYLDAGTYVIEEEKAPDNTVISGSAKKTITVNEGFEETAEFDNKERLGEVRILKVDKNNKPLAGAEFQLYRNPDYTDPVRDKDGNIITERTNSNEGYNAVFTRLPADTYYLKETKAPNGYMIPSGAISPATVDPDNPAGQVVKVTNQKNEANIQLTKLYSTVTDPDNFIVVGSEDYQKFEDAFELQQSTNGSVWTKIDTYSIDDKGKTRVIAVPIYDANGTPYQYRFEETVPAGFFGVGDNIGPATRKVDSDAITPASGQTEIEMRNRKGGIIELTKKKVSVNKTQGTYDELEGGKKFDLYRIPAGSTAAEKVASGETSSSDTDKGKVRFTGLESVTSDTPGKTYTYYVVETNPDADHPWLTDSTISISGTPTPALKVGSFTEKATISRDTYNIEQNIRIKIRKTDARNNQALLKGAQFLIYTDDGEDITVDNKNGEVYQEIELGTLYHIKETVAPVGYYKDESIKDIDTTGWKVTVKDGKYVVVKADGTTVVTEEELTYTFNDIPYQKIRLKKLQKRNKDEDTPVTLNGVTFSVYTYDQESGKFVPVKDKDGKTVTIAADDTATVSLPEGDYYLHEDTEKAGILYPDKYHELYESKLGPDKCKYEEATGMFFFGAYHVINPGTTGDLELKLQLINIKNTGNLKVNKVLFKADNTRSDNHGGFRMDVYRADESGKPTGSSVAHKTTGPDGMLEFTDLPVYDENGSVIKYVVKETYDKEKYYTDKDTTNPALMVLGGTVNAGTIENHTYMSVKAIKKYYDAREHELTGLEYELEGAEIALYRKDAENQYTFITTGTTNSKGEITFGKLEYSALGFVAIEVSVPDRPEYKYMRPVSGDYLEPDAQGKFPQTLTDVSGLSKVALTKDDEPDPYTGTIYNVIPWTQIHVIKYDELERNKKLSGANFTLYKQVLPEGTREGELTFNADNCTVVGEYTSGTWIHNDEPQEGEFQTDVLENADNVVYWLVETKAPSGYSIIDDYKIVLFPREGTDYTNKSNDGKSTMVYPGGLKDNQINYFDVYNRPNVGPGGTENWAFIEFNKWRQKENTADKERKDLLRSDFTLMPNATFELYAVNKKDHNKVFLLDTITTGDENDDFSGNKTTGYGVSRSMDAWAIFDKVEKEFPDQLDDIITYHSAQDSGYDVTYPYVVGPDGKPITDAEGRRTRIKGTFVLNAVLIEKSASSKYELDLHDHNMQITFIPSSLSLGNDKYAVPIITKPGDRGGYSSDLCDNDARRLDYEDNDSQSMAIVDYLSTDNSVVLRHFGYDPEQVGYEKLHADLETLHEDNPSLFTSKEVTFYLQKYDTTAKKWVPWSPTKNEQNPNNSETFKTDGNGYHFDAGLDPGEYRVVMTKPAAGYENFYPNAATSFHFTVVVSDRTQTFTTYSPSRPATTIEKTDQEGKTVSQAAKFKLAKAKTGASYSKEIKTVDGKATFTDLPSDTTFTLTEIEAPEGFTNEYFALLFAMQNPGFEDLVTGDNGYPVSYKTTTKPSGESSIDGSKLHEKVIVKPAEGKEYNKAFYFKAPNVKTVKITLKKKDAQAEPEKLLEGAKFRIYYHSFDKVTGDYTVPKYTEGDPSWHDLGEVTTGEDGTISKTGLNPGVYYVVETAAPEGYDIATDGQTIVMTGGLGIVVQDKPKEYTVNRAVGGEGVLDFEDLPKVPMKVYKEVSFGEVPVRDYDFTFTLKDSEKNTIKGDPANATGKASGGAITDKTHAEFKNLSQGKTYYLKEEIPTGKDKYKIESVKVGDTTLTPETSGDFKDYYKITIPTDGSTVEVNVKNILLEARVTVFKYDGATGDALTGAVFEVQKNEGGKRVKVSGSSVTDNGDGSYTAIIPLAGTDGEDFFIHETQAPAQHTVDEGNADIAVTDLKPGEHPKYKFNGKDAGDNELCLPNFEGITVKLQKYGNLPGNTNKKLAGVQFQLYYRKSLLSSWSTWHDPETTNADGIAEFEVLKNYEYAVAEIDDVAGYDGIYGVYDGDTKLPTGHTALGKTVYILGKQFDYREDPYEFTAYNIPFLKLIVKKLDNSTPKVEHPDVDFHVYEVPDNLVPKDPKDYDSLTEAQIKAIADAATADDKYISGQTHQQTETFTNSSFIRPGKTYLGVEDHAIDRDSQKDDYSIIKDDTRVVSYKMFTVPEEGYKDQYEVVFENVKGDVPIYLEKTVDPTKNPSLTLADAELTYTIETIDPDNPDASNTYALDSYKLNDSGLTPDPSDASLVHEWYNITEITVGQAAMDKLHLRGADPEKDYPIEATVTFEDFDGTKYKQDAVDVSTGSKKITPTGIGDKKIKSFFVEYSSPEFLKDTGYALGQNFQAQKVEVKAKVFKQEPIQGAVIKEVKKVTNKADLEIKYTPWTSKGVKADQKTLTAKDDAVTEFEGVEAPKVEFDKTGPDPAKMIDLGQKLTYTLTVTNITDKPIDFTDPIIVDLLPRGVVVDQSSQFVKVTKKPDTIADNPAVTVGYAGDSEYVNIAFAGTLPAKDPDDPADESNILEVELTATATDAVTNYGSEMRNYAFTTSKEVGVATSDNTAGAVIKDDKGVWASELVSKAEALGCEPARAQALKDALREQGKYGYLGDFHENLWVSDNQLVCIKDQYGPSDGGVYRTDKVSVLVNDEDHDDQRTMHYRLTINNLSASKRTNLVVMDILPDVGDHRFNNTDRESNWDLYFLEMGNITVNGETCTDYTVYYYTGKAESLTAEKIDEAIDEARSSCPTGWTDSKPEKPTAFIVAFNYDPTDATQTSDGKTVVLNGQKNLQIEYTALTDYREAEELNKIVYTNAANDFNFGFSTMGPSGTADKADKEDTLGSNVVEVTIAPPKVKVGGDVWIDADSNGVQDDGKQSWYLDFKIVKKLIPDLSVILNTSNNRDYSILLPATDGTIIETGNDTNVDDKYGIAHFEFEDLTSAKLRNGSKDYKNWNADRTAANLIGKNPYTYNMVMNYKGTTFAKTKNVVDPRGSYVPVPGGIPDADREDDNFNVTRGEYKTEQFFLHPTSDPNWDMTKDNGYNVLRTLNLTKTSMSTGEALEGAEFTIYGPFDHDTGKDQKLSDDNKVAVITTDKDGKASYGKLYSFIDPDADQELLFFFKEYVIVETKPAEGYSVEGAEADGANITKLDEGKWLLGVPKTDSEEQVEEVAVRDPGNIEVSVEKKWDDDEDAYGTRPESITVMLYTDESCTAEAKYADGKTVESRKLDESNKWKTTWEDLPRYKVVYGVRTPITYYVKETDSATGKDLNGYDVTIVASRDEQTGNQHLEITNKPISTGLDVRKKWKDTKDIAASVTAVKFRVEQSADGENWTPVRRKGEEIYLTIERKSGETMGTAKVDDLPAYDADNNPLTYRAVETSITVNGKTLEVKDGKVGPYEVSEVHTPGKDVSPEKATARDLSEITNTMVPTQFNVEKTFVDEFGISKGIKTVTVMLQRKVGNGKWTDVEKVDLTKWGGWKHTWKELPKYDWNGNAYDYRAVEVSYTTKKGNTVAVKYINNDKVAGTVGAYVYTATISGTADSGFTSHIENNLLIGALEVKKQWKDAKGKKIPDSLKITLKALADGKSISLSGVKKSTILDDSNDWADDTTWAELPVYTADGKLISYRLTESGKGKFTAEYKIKYNGEVIDEGDGETLDVTIYANDTVKATFINKPQGPPKTGDNAPLTGYLALCLISLAGLLMIFLKKWRRNN